MRTRRKLRGNWRRLRFSESETNRKRSGICLQNASAYEKGRVGIQPNQRGTGQGSGEDGRVEPAVDDKYIDRIARLTIYTNKVEMYIDSNNATVDTYVKVTDIKLKQSKMLDMAINQLAIARRDRLGKQTESSLMNELREAMLRGMKTTA